MSYTAPYFDSVAGLVIPTYTDIRNDLIEDFKAIYGQDCYLEEDSADYQWISIVALRIHDTLSSIQLSYNNRAPATAVGSGLDQIVKMNGITRASATYSTCEVILTGTVGTVISNGVITDVSGNKWDLPATVTLLATGSPAVGQATETAVCQTIGSITALPGDLVNITTPTYGWTSVTNTAAATAGQAVETDTELRMRQALSVARPSMDLLSGTMAAIAAVENVTRYNVLENVTNLDDAYGNPPHSITCVVEGGTNDDIADAIYLNRGLGVLTNCGLTAGDPPVPVDPNGRCVAVTSATTGIITYIGFYRPEYIDIYVTAEIYPLAGYTSATAILIQNAINNYLNSLQIGEDVTVSAVIAAAMAVTADLTKPSFSITDLYLSKVASPGDSVDIVLLFNQVSYCETSFVTINTPSEYPD
jgi:uncharacterized phage protein gp47/JayE